MLTPRRRRTLPTAPQVCSFDVFDTVLTRAVGSSEAVLRETGRALRDTGGLPVEPSTFAAVRAQSADRLIAARGREATLAEIYDEVVAALGLPASVAQRGLEAELAVERRVSRALPGAGTRLQAARAVGRVAFVSDTPLPAAFVQELLEAAGLWHDGDRLYVSSELLLTKTRGGELYEAVVRDLGVTPEQVRHTGDNVLSDVAEARLRGVVAVEAPEGRLDRYEELLESESVASDGLSSYLAGASRLARMRAVREGVDPVLAAGAAGVAAPLLVGFAAWLVQQVREHDLQRLYFVSRDAEVMLQVFLPVASALGCDVRASYLYGSRSAWELTSLHDASAAEIRDRLLGHRGDSLVQATHRLGLTPRDVPELLGGQSEHAARHVPLPDRALERLAEAASTEPLLSRVRGAAAERRELMLAYLAQEGLATDGPVSGLVDVGWMGRTFQALDTAMEQASLPAVHSYFYVGRSSLAPRWSAAPLLERQRSWLFDQVRPGGRADQPSGIEAAVEAICTGTEGSLRGYAREGDRIVPILASDVNRASVDWGLPGLRRTLDLVTEELTSAEAPLGRTADLRGAADAVLRALWLRPSSDEVALWGRFPTDEGDDHGGVRPLAVEVKTADVVTQLRAGHLKIRPVFSWRAGTAAVSRAPWQQLLSSMVWYDEHRTRLRALPRRVRLRRARRG